MILPVCLASESEGLWWTETSWSRSWSASTQWDAAKCLMSMHWFLPVCLIALPSAQTDVVWSCGSPVILSWVQLLHLVLLIIHWKTRRPVMKLWLHCHLSSMCSQKFVIFYCLLTLATFESFDEIFTDRAFPPCLIILGHPFCPTLAPHAGTLVLT